jgi:hypothetical protein
MAASFKSLPDDPMAVVAMTPAELGQLVLKNELHPSSEFNRNNLSNEIQARYPRDTGPNFRRLSSYLRSGRVLRRAWFMILPLFEPKKSFRNSKGITSEPN